MPSLGDYLIIGVVAAVVTFVATPVVGWYRQAAQLGVHPQRTVGAHVARARCRWAGDADRLLRRARCGADARSVRRLVRDQHRAAGRRDRGRHHLHRRLRRRHPRHPAAGEGDRHGPRRRGPGLVRRDDVLRPRAVLRRDRPLVGLEAAGHRAVAAGDDAGDQSHRRARRTRRRDRRHRGRRVLPLQQPARRARPVVAAEHRSVVRDHHGRAVPRLPPAQLQPGADLHGRRRGLPPRVADGRLDERRRRARRSRTRRDSSARRSSSSLRW